MSQRLVFQYGTGRNGKATFIEQYASGVYVAFDRNGRHYAYAVHPIRTREQGRQSFEAQKRDVAKLQKQARRAGGTWRLLTGAEFSALIADMPSREDARR